MRVRLVVFFAILIPAFGLTSPSRLNVHAASPQVNLTTLKVGITPTSEMVDLFAAIDRGFFRKEKINLQTTTMSGGAVILPAVEGGSLDIGRSNVLSLLIADSQGLGMAAVTPGAFNTPAHQDTGIMVAKDSPIRSGKDLEGKTVAVNTINSGSYLATHEWMKKHGADPTKVHWTELDYTKMLPALLHGQIDAGVMADPYGTIAKASGARTIGPIFRDLRKNVVVATFVAKRSWAQAHSSLLKRFVAGYKMGIAWVKKHHKAARTILLTHTTLTPELADRIKLPVERGMRPADLNFWVRLATKWGILTKSVDVNQAIWPTSK